ncbi:MAG: flagellar biosynthesis protein [Clostridiales bacterium]|jgi:flagellar biosynthesis protein|nr:flagellar biosynthesis protein [Clostridiales bacterium]MDK2932609.1 flagellar biosynthesis protein [Clostridiales bacterium]
MGKRRTEMKKAAAIKYNMGEHAPKIIASGKGKIAQNIIDKAKENKVPIYQDPELAHMLNLLQIGDEIPPELYEIVAQILVFVSDLDKLKGES